MMSLSVCLKTDRTSPKRKIGRSIRSGHAFKKNLISEVYGWADKQIKEGKDNIRFFAPSFTKLTNEVVGFFIKEPESKFGVLDI